MPGEAADRSLSPPHVWARMFEPDYFGFGDTADITTGASTHTDQPLPTGTIRRGKHTHWTPSGWLAWQCLYVLAHCDWSLPSIYDTSPIAGTQSFWIIFCHLPEAKLKEPSYICMPQHLNVKIAVMWHWLFQVNEIQFNLFGVAFLISISMFFLFMLLRHQIIMFIGDKQIHTEAQRKGRNKCVEDDESTYCIKVFEEKQVVTDRSDFPQRRVEWKFPCKNNSQLVWSMTEQACGHTHPLSSAVWKRNSIY